MTIEEREAWLLRWATMDKDMEQRRAVAAEVQAEHERKMAEFRAKTERLEELSAYSRKERKKVHLYFAGSVQAIIFGFLFLWLGQDHAVPVLKWLGLALVIGSLGLMQAAAYINQAISTKMRRAMEELL